MGNFLFSEFNSNILALDMGSWAMHMHCPYRLQDSIDQSKTSGKKKKKNVCGIVEECHQCNRNDKKFMDNRL